MLSDVDLLYRQHLSDADRRLLEAAAPGPLVAALASPRVEEAVFGVAGPGAPGASHGEPFPPRGLELALNSPFLTFAVAVHRTAARLANATFIEEPWSPRHRIPVFDVQSLRALLAEPLVCYFLIELLASYTHVSSGTTWERTRRGWRRRRFSELDPVRLAGLLEVVGPAERPGVYRRLGDLALFLSGVFPDHEALFDLGEVGTERLLRLSGLREAGRDRPTGRELLESLGARWYRQAVASARAAGAPSTAALQVVGEVAEHFGEARRALNVVTDWYLFPVRRRWFGVG